MNADQIKRLFQQVKQGKLTPDEAVQQLQHLPFEDLGFAKVDHHRAVRVGMPEVIFSQGKTPTQVATIFETLSLRKNNVLATRATTQQYEEVRNRVKRAEYHTGARCITLRLEKKKYGKGKIVVVS